MDAEILSGGVASFNYLRCLHAGNKYPKCELNKKSFSDTENVNANTWCYGILKDLLNLDFCGNRLVFIRKILNLKRFQGCTGSNLSGIY